MDKLLCKICGKEYSHLSMHTKKTHFYEWDDYCKEFNWPLWKKTINSIEPEIVDNNNLLKCKICNKYFNKLRLHINNSHTILWEDYCKKFNWPIWKSEIRVINPNEKNKINHKNINLILDLLKYQIINYSDKDMWICAICGKIYPSLKRHIEYGHNLKWEDYCKKFNWDKTKKQLFSKEHIDNLSINKSLFYQTERGLELKKKHKRDWTGNKNPGCKIENRKKTAIQRSIDAACKIGSFSKESTEKRSISMTHNFLNTNCRKRSNMGKRFIFYYNNIKYICRSFEEFKIIYTLLINNKSFEYEKYAAPYIRKEDGYKLHSVIDLCYNGDLYEIKGTTDDNLDDIEYTDKNLQITKYIESFGLNLYFVNYNRFLEITKFKFIDNWEDIVLDLLKQNKNNKIEYQFMGQHSTFVEKNKFNSVRKQIICTNL